MWAIAVAINIAPTDETQHATDSRVEVLQVLRQFCEHGIEGTARETNTPARFRVWGLGFRV